MECGEWDGAMEVEKKTGKRYYKKVNKSSIFIVRCVFVYAYFE